MFEGRFPTIISPQGINFIGGVEDRVLGRDVLLVGSILVNSKVHISLREIN